MFYINIVDKNNNKLEIFSSRSQSGIDKITSAFEDESSFLKAIKLDSNFKVKKKKNTNKNKGLEEISYADYRYREILPLGKDTNEQNKFLEKVSKLDRSRLYEYYLNESLNRYEKVEDGSYDSNRGKMLDQVIRVFQEDNNSNEEFSNNLLQSLKLYYRDFHGNFLYDNSKTLYEYLLRTNSIEPKYIELTDDEKKEISNMIYKMRDIIQGNVTYKDGKPEAFIGSNKTNETNSNNDKETVDDFVTDVADKYDDIDTKMTELDIFLDSKNMDNEQKNRYLEENKSKLFK